MYVRVTVANLEAGELELAIYSLLLQAVHPAAHAQGGVDNRMISCP